MNFRVVKVGGDGSAVGSQVALDFEKIVSVSPNGKASCNVKMINGDLWVIESDFNVLVMQLQTLSKG